MQRKNSRVVYYVRRATTGAGYLVKTPYTKSRPSYRWAKTKKCEAAVLNLSQAKKLSNKYGGVVVRRTYVITEETV